MKHLISPSLLSADFGNLQRDIEMINESDADWLHLDIMDGVFVPNISFGFPVVEYAKKHAKKPLDVHLMIVEPDRYINSFKDAGANILTIHYETCNHLHRSIQKIKSLGMKAGVSLNPHTPVNVLEDILNEIDLVLIMSVNPGFGGQTFIPRAYDKINKLNRMRKDSNASFLIEVDGGVTPSNIQKLVNNGADVLVAGSSVFKSGNPKKTISMLKNL